MDSPRARPRLSSPRNPRLPHPGNTRTLTGNSLARSSRQQCGDRRASERAHLQLAHALTALPKRKPVLAVQHKKRPRY